MKVSTKSYTLPSRGGRVAASFAKVDEMVHKLRKEVCVSEYMCGWVLFFTELYECDDLFISRVNMNPHCNVWKKDCINAFNTMVQGANKHAKQPDRS